MPALAATSPTALRRFGKNRSLLNVLGRGPRAKLPVGFIDCSKQIGKAGHILHRPQPFKGGAEQVQVALGKQADGYDTFVSHGDSRVSIESQNG